jgi:hypothetical protein
MGAGLFVTPTQDFDLDAGDVGLQGIFLQLFSLGVLLGLFRFGVLLGD